MSTTAPDASPVQHKKGTARLGYSTHYVVDGGKARVILEPLFAEPKDWHESRRFRLQTLEKVNAEALLIATGQNIKRLLIHGQRGPRRPAQVSALRQPPSERRCSETTKLDSVLPLLDLMAANHAVRSGMKTPLTLKRAMDHRHRVPARRHPKPSR